MPFIRRTAGPGAMTAISPDPVDVPSAVRQALSAITLESDLQPSISVRRVLASLPAEVQEQLKPLWGPLPELNESHFLAGRDRQGNVYLLSPDGSPARGAAKLDGIVMRDGQVFQVGGWVHNQLFGAKGELTLVPAHEAAALYREPPQWVKQLQAPAAPEPASPDGFDSGSGA